MKIALLGYGKMGMAVEEVALQRRHEIVCRVSHDITDYDLTGADVAIDFSIPDSAFENISLCLKLGIPVISGTTGWLKKYDDIVSICLEQNGAFIYASNFSLGVNIFFEINRKLAAIIGGQEQYKARIKEIHHTEKLDAPSGTAITLAQDIIRHSTYENWSSGEDVSEKAIRVSSERIKDVKGTHTVEYTSEVDAIRINHEAFSRKGFALGAVVAAEWLQGKTGVFSMRDVLNIG
ncbi:MAG: 4-hydroxy-tetrahydrodipicolinate reductase [Bacteroidia bacterium]|nr:4-hydroxy-tetrahydrodipicolinate reductase [Bacteroidia bacterium]